jgi:hypothetical protein
MNTEDEVFYKGHRFELVETRAFRWRVFENNRFLVESFSRRKAIIEAEIKVDAEVQK